jgi:hypothetical protein
MKITEILRENIFTTDYHMVMDAVARLYDTHYSVNIWENGQAHDEAAKVLLKVHPSEQQLQYIIKTGELPEEFQDLDFPINDELINGGAMVGEDDLEEGDLEEGPAPRSACLSSKKLSSSWLSSCKSQGLRPRKSRMKFNVRGDGPESIDGRKIPGKKYGGPLPDYS